MSGVAGEGGMFASLGSDSGGVSLITWLRGALVQGGMVALLLAAGSALDSGPPETARRKWTQIALQAPRMRVEPLPKATPLPPVIAAPRRSVRAAEWIPPRQPAKAPVLEMPAPPVVAPAPVVAMAPRVAPLAVLPAPPPKPVVGLFEASLPAQAEKGASTVAKVAEAGSFDAKPAWNEREASRQARVVDAGFSAAERIEGRGGRRELVASALPFGGGAMEERRARGPARIANGFDLAAAEPNRQPKRDDVPAGGFSPVEILSKPSAGYTEEARKLGIEGEVLVRVLFGGDGKSRVLTIERGLGHGLDENAAIAVARIQFRPAMRQGHPVDQAAVVRVQFLLAR